ncbi:oxidoreductase, short chain dehydrogenase/reductase family protein, partial [Cooperia oncophora]
NAHIVLGSGKPISHRSTAANTALHILPISGSSEKACVSQCRAIAEYLRSRSDVDLEAVAATLQQRRDHFKYRAAFAVRSVQEAVSQLEAFSTPIHSTPLDNSNICFLFAPQGVQYPNMEKITMDYGGVFKNELERLIGLASKLFQVDFMEIMYPTTNTDSGMILAAKYAQVVLFIISRAVLAQLDSWGISSDFLIGHSVGEYAAACYSGIIDEFSCMKLLKERGELVSTTKEAKMLAVVGFNGALPDDIEVTAHLSDTMKCVVGPPGSIEALKEMLSKKGIAFKELSTDHGFHSSMMDCIQRDFVKAAKKIPFRKGTKKIVSNINGESLGDLWALGYDVDFGKVFGSRSFDPNMPVYQFDQISCWRERIIKETTARYFKASWSLMTNTQRQNISMDCSVCKIYSAKPLEAFSFSPEELTAYSLIVYLPETDPTNEKKTSCLATPGHLLNKTYVEVSQSEKDMQLGETVVVIGGGGAIGSAYVDVLRKRPDVQNIVIASRYPKERVIPKVSYVSMDLGDRTSVASALDEVRRRFAVLVTLQGADDYAAANLFLDALALKGHTNVNRILAVQWPSWKDAGMASTYKNDALKSILSKASISTAVGRRVIRETLGMSGIVTYSPLPPPQMAKMVEEIQLKGNARQSPMAREHLSLIDKVISVWNEILCTEIHEKSDFFDNGGNSL